MSCLFGHKWNGCKCSKCDKTRNEQHTWANDNGIAHCSVCGEKAIDIHLFSEEEKQFLIAAFLSYSTNVGVNLVTANNMRLLSTQIAMSKDNSNLAYFDRNLLIIAHFYHLLIWCCQNWKTQVQFPYSTK